MLALTPTTARPPRDQVPGLETPPRSRPRPDLPGLGRPNGARPLHRDDPRGAGLQGPGRARHGRRQRSIRPRLRPHLHRGGCRHHRHGGAAGGGHPPQRPPRHAGLRPRDVQPSGPVLPTAQRRSDRCRAGRHRLGVRGVTPVPHPADEPHRGGGPGRLDDGRTDGVREAVGAPVVQPPRAAGARAVGRARPRHPGRCRRHWRRRWGTSTWRTSIRRTTNTGISPTITCGRRWWPGMRPRPTAWRASGSTPATRRRTRRSTPSARCPLRWPRWSNPSIATCLVLSYNDESWLELEELEAMCSIQRPAEGTDERDGTGRATGPGVGRSQRSPSTRLDTSAPASASSTPPGARWAG